MFLNFDRQKIIKICDLAVQSSIILIVFLTPLVFAFDQGNFNIFELNKLLIFRSLLCLGLIFFSVKVVITGSWSRFFRSYFWVSCLLLAGYVLLSLSWSIDIQQSLFGNYSRQQGIISLLYYWLWFGLLICSLDIKVYWRPLLISITSSSALVCCYGLLQKFGFDWLLWAEPGTGRVFSSLGQPNFLAYYLGLAIFFTLASLAVFKVFWQRALLIFLLILQFSVLIFTASRGAFFGLLVGLLVLGFLKFYHRLSRQLIIRTSLICLSFCLLIFLALTQLSVADSPVISRYTSAFSQVQGSSRVRLFYWQAAWHEFQAAPWSRRLLGYGKDSQAEVFVRHYQARWGLHEKLNSYPDRAHNLIIDLWLEFGLIGLVLFGIFNLLIIGQALLFYLRQPSHPSSQLLPYLLSASAVYFVSNLFGFSLTTHYLYYYLILACLLVLSFDFHTSDIKLSVSKPFLILVAISLNLFLAFSLWQFTWRAFIADRAFMQAKQGESSFDCPQAINGVERSLAWHPLDLYYQSQSLFIYNNCLPLVDDSTRQQLISTLLQRLASAQSRLNDYDYAINLARSYSLLGLYLDKQFYHQAANYYQGLIKLSPDILSAYQDYARMLIWAGDYPQAESILHQAIARSPMQLPDYQSSGYQLLTARHTYYLQQLLGDCAYHQGRFTEALKIYHDIESKQLISLELYKNIADSHYQLKDYQISRDYLAKALKLAPASQELLTGINQLDQLLQKEQ